MPHDDRPRVRRRRVRLASALVTTLAMQATVIAVAWRQGDLDPFLGDEPATITLDAPAIEVPAPDGLAPDGLALPTAQPAPPVLQAPAGPRIDVETLEARVAPLLAAPRFGDRIGFVVYDLTHDTRLLQSGFGAYMPASTLKLLTATAVLEQLGPAHRFSTRVTLDAGAPDADGVPTVSLVGGGDPLLAGDGGDPSVYPQPVTMRDLVAPTVAALRAEGTRRVRVGFDDSLFTGPSASPTWEEQYVPGVTTPVSALWFDEGIDPDTGLRASNPAALAGERFAEALTARGIRVVGEPARTPAGPTELVSLEGPALEAIVGSVLGVSDNEGAEVLLRQLAIGAGQPASFAGGARAMRTVLTGLGVSWRGVEVYDGSGLSRANAIPLQTLLDVLRLGADEDLPHLRSVLTGLPVAGFDGSLTDRYVAPGTLPGNGLVRAKTGTLSGTHGLAGVVVAADGVQLAFVVLANGVAERHTLFARDQLDRLSAALAACGCSRPG